MYKVILVDDEYLDLEGMKQLVPWAELGLSVEAAVYSGYTALEAMKEEVDILITDIKMPIMSGMELAEKARQLHPRLKIIFVSGYEDFHYAKKAIAIHANGYVLKPIDDAELLKVLQDVTEQLEREKRSLVVEDRYPETIPILRNELMYQWLEGKADAAALSSLTALWEQEGWPYVESGAAALIEIDDLAWKLNELEKTEQDAAISDIHDLIIERIKAEKDGYFCKLSNKRIVWIMSSCPEGDSRLGYMIEEVKKSTGFTITAGVGPEVSCLERIPDSFRRAEEALSHKMFMGKGRVILADRADKDITLDVTELESCFRHLFQAMAEYDLVRVHDGLEQLFVVVQKLRNKVTVYNLALHTFSKLDLYLQSINENIYQILDIEFTSRDELLQLETIEDIKTWLRRKLFTISEFLHVKKQMPNQRLVRDMKKYVEEHLSDNITLRDIANVFGFSPNYLGYIFKEATSESFGDFLIDVRLEKAKELLKDPKLKIYEIAERVGYRNLAYFGRQFKERFGVTPGDFRK